MEKRNVDIINGLDVWSVPDNHTISDASQPSVTYRAFGGERFFYKKDNKIYDESSGIFDQASGGVSYPMVTTERPKRENLFFMHRSYDEHAVDIYQIAP